MPWTRFSLNWFYLFSQFSKNNGARNYFYQVSEKNFSKRDNNLKSKQILKCKKWFEQYQKIVVFFEFDLLKFSIIRPENIFIFIRNL